MIDLSEVRAIESMCLSGWPVLKSAWDGAWQFRYAAGLTKRGNSIHCLDPADGAGADGRLAAMAGLYRDLGLPPVLRVTPLTAPALVDAAEAQGWEANDASDVLAGEIGASDTVRDPGIGEFAPQAPAFLSAQIRLQAYSETQARALSAIADAILVPARGFVAHDEEGEPVASALAVNAFGLAGYFNVIVAEAHRGRGLGRRLMRAAIGWTARSGARRAAIQTLADNAVAQQLYRSLGFAPVYAYSYRRGRA